MTFTKEQESALIKAMSAYEKSRRRIEDAQKDGIEKLNVLRTVSGSSATGETILDEAKKILGELYLIKAKADSDY